MRTSLSSSLALIAMVLGLACGSESQRDQATSDEAMAAVSGRIEGEIFLSSADEHSGTVIYCAGTNQSAFSDSSGVYAFFNMPLGEYHLFARHEGYQEADLGVHEITAEAPLCVIPSVTLVRTAAEILMLPDPVMGAVSGRVTRGGGISSAGIRVSVLGAAVQTRTDEEGRWLLREVTPGLQTIQFSAMGYELDEAEVQVLPDRLVEIPPVMLAPALTVEEVGDRRIHGSVALVGPDGALESDYRSVWVVLEGTSQTVAPDSQGRFEFTDLPPRVYRLAARADGFRDGEVITVDLRETPEFEATLFLDREISAASSTGAVTGTVQMGGGGSAAGATIAVGGTGLMTVTDASGRFTIQGIPAGEVLLIAQAPQHAVVERSGIQVRAGETTDVGTLRLERAMEAPRVISSSPPDGARDVLLLPEISVQIRFSTAMDTASVIDAIELDPELPHSTAMGRGSAGGDDDLLLIQFSTGEGGISHRDRVRIQIGTGARSSEGVPLQEPHAIRFTMGEPELYASTPPNGSSGHPSDQMVTLRFNAELRTENIDTGFTFSPRPPVEPQVRVERDPQTGWSIVRLVVTLTPNQRYTLRLSNRLRTAGGQRLGGTREIEFETGSQMVFDYYGEPAPRDDSVIY